MSVWIAATAMYREVHALCPRCRVSLERDEEASLERCARCDGVWIDELQLLEMLRERHPGRMLDELLEHNDGSERRDCAVCGPAGRREAAEGQGRT